jgi:hypothetical protein
MGWALEAIGKPSYYPSHNENISEYGGFPIACYTHHMDSFGLQTVIDDGILLCNHYWHQTVTFLNSSDTSIIY